MPDGRVWTAGGNAAEQPEGAPGASQRTFEIFRPPYPAGPRPNVLAAPSIVTYDENFTFRVTPTAGIGSVVLMRCGSATHAFDGDQRAVYLRFRVSAPDRIVATAPPNGNVAPPGPYMLFAVDRDGRPCEYAKFVSLSTLADDGSRFAAIWREPAAVSWVTRHNLTAAHYQREFDELVGRQGFAPKLVNAHTVGGQPRFSGIWEKSAPPAPAFVARHEIDTAALQGEFDRLTPQGFRPVVISGYEKNGTHHFAALFEQRQGPTFDARFGLAPGQLQQTHEHNVNHRFRLRMINGDRVGAALTEPGHLDPGRWSRVYRAAWAQQRRLPSCDRRERDPAWVDADVGVLLSREWSGQIRRDLGSPAAVVVGDAARSERARIPTCVQRIFRDRPQATGLDLRMLTGLEAPVRNCGIASCPFNFEWNNFDLAICLKKQGSVVFLANQDER